jgi:dTDP-4-amino-4,6-dideoxygalactose transaminase
MQFENRVDEFAGVQYGVATMNGKAALDIAMELAGVKSRRRHMGVLHP